MADKTMNTNPSSNQTMQHEKAKAEVSGERKQPEQGNLDRERQEKGAIGGQSGSQTGEPGRARSELDKDQTRSESDKSRSEFDKSRTQPTGQR